MPYRTLLLLVCLFTLWDTGFCQDREDQRDAAFFQAMPLKHIALKTQGSSTDTLPFCSISIIDARYDTLSLGFKYPTYPRVLSRYERMVFTDTTCSGEIKNYITHNYVLSPAADSAWKLVIVLDKFWFTYTMLKDSARVGVYRDGLIVKANMLAERNGELHPLYQLDTIYTRRLLQTNDNATMLQRGVDKMLDKVKNKNVALLKISKRSLSYNDIGGYVHNKLNIPILLTEEYKKGIYLSFDEFKNNAPSIPGYEVTYKGKFDLLRGWDKDSTPVSMKKAWGFSDGHNLYICRGENFFKLFKTGNTFDTKGFKSYTYVNVTDVFIFESGFVLPIPNGGTYKDIKMPLQLDMETGELF